MSYLLALITATAISLLVVPAMVRLAPRMGMIDHPNSRKVHVTPIPRVGGFGIVAGAICTVIIWAPINGLVLSYMVGSLVLLTFGSWDDKKDLGPYTKFLGQLIAVLLLIVIGGLYVTSFPFLKQPLPFFLGAVFTLFAMVGVINAVNTSDGLDGLAGGLSILSFAAIMFLAYLVAGNNIVLIIVIAVIGGTFGFLRYNTYPASVFMGDGGSQFLGYNLGFLVVLLTQYVDTELSPLIVLLILGLPVVDIIAVMIRRVRAHVSMFKATNDHLHHRLLRLGFVHKETVVIIYSIQSIFVLSGIYLRYANEWLIAVLYIIFCGLLYTMLHLAESRGWQVSKVDILDSVADRLNIIRLEKLLVIAPRRFLEVVIPFYLVAVSLWVNDVPRDFGMVAAVLTLVVVLTLILMKQPKSTLHRILIYTTAAFVVYLSFEDRASWGARVYQLEKVFFGFVTLAIMVAVRFTPGRRTEEFKTTAMDYLLVFVILSGILIFQTNLIEFDATVFLVELIIILYGCEFLFIERRQRMNWLNPALLLTLGIITLRGLDIIQLQLIYFK